ncbi:MAG: lysine--tRNA ligase [Syntrophales bacterium]|nr:lysine--tRNA ligase [Syntrophales bacterium]
MTESELIRARKDKIRLLREMGVELYPNDVRVKDTTGTIRQRFGDWDEKALANLDEKFSIAGRMMAVRDFGKGAFITVQDRHGKLQAFLRKNNLEESTFSLFKKLDVGDIVFVAGKLFRTKTKELTIDVEEFRLLAKAVRPLPEKWHGLTDVELRYRLRHLDLITHPHVVEIFKTRSRIISLIRKFMEERDFLEVETPMMQPKPGGAAAKPFKTYHNALGMELYLRIAPELYLKRLVTGGLERVFEINRSFRNEGVSSYHNPEFTMMEFYQAYANYEDLMTITEELFVYLAKEIKGTLQLTYQGKTIDLTPPWRRITVWEAVKEHYKLSEKVLSDRRSIADFARSVGLKVSENDSFGKILMNLFEAQEENLIQPTFVTQYPVEVSPLARRNPANPAFTDRFELYICGKEIANAFSELNDPEDQRERFIIQAREREEGNEEAHVMDEDFIEVLEYAMPPTAGEGIGIDRLVMLFTDSPSIREVILFPHMRIKNG